MVEVSLEDEQVGFRQVKEEIGSFGVEIPVGKSGAPEWVLLVDPDTLLFVFLSNRDLFQFLRPRKEA